MKYLMATVVVLILAWAGWHYFNPTGPGGAPATAENSAGQINTGQSSTGRIGCASVVSAAELNNIFGAGNFSLQSDNKSQCIFATGEIKGGIGPGVIALSLSVLPNSPASLGAAENSLIKNGATAIAAVPHAYLLGKNMGVIMFRNGYTYTFGVGDGAHSNELIALAKLIASK